MIYVIGGEDTVSSRNKLIELTEGSKNIIRLDGKKTSFAEIEMALESDSLFGDQKIVVIEQFSKVKPTEKLIELVSPFEKDQNTTIILWDDIETKSKITIVKGSNNFIFSYPKAYFSFLDALSPKDSAKQLILLRQVLKTYSAEQVLYSIIKRVRQLLIMKPNNYQEFEEFKKMQSWQIGKLKNQANLWTDEQLKKAFISFVDLDEKIKTGGLTMDLSSHLDMVILSDLN